MDCTDGGEHVYLPSFSLSANEGIFFVCEGIIDLEGRRWSEESLV